MEIIKLDSSHAEMVRPFFYVDKFMGLDLKTDFSNPLSSSYADLTYNTFCDAYLSGLNNFKSFASIECNEVTAIISFYESTDSASWYGTHVKSKNSKAIPFILDKVMEYNESNGRLKFYSMFNSRYARSYRRLFFSETAKERYDFFDEFIVPEKTKCIYLEPWQVLFTRTLVPAETLVRCTFLKQKYRTTLPIGGNI